MKKLISIVVMLSVNTFSTLAYAKEVDCPGKVTLIMGGHINCGENLAFWTNSSANKWMCSNSKSADAVLLSAHATGKIVHPSIDDSHMTNKDCSTLAHYKKINYVYMD